MQEKWKELIKGIEDVGDVAATFFVGGLLLLLAILLILLLINNPVAFIIVMLFAVGSFILGRIFIKYNQKRGR